MSLRIQERMEMKYFILGEDAPILVRDKKLPNTNGTMTS